METDEFDEILKNISYELKTILGLTIFNMLIMGITMFLLLIILYAEYA